MPFRRFFGQVFWFEGVTAAVVAVLIVAVLAYALIRYRARPGRKATQDTEHKLIEGIYAVVILLVAVGIVTYTANANAKVQGNGSKPALTVAVTGFQWCWSFRYVEAGVTVTATCDAGDDPVLMLPVGEKVAITTTSDDVIHSFWVPHFRYKMDAFPHHLNSFDITIPTQGQWAGHCAEFCGLKHATMLFTLRAVPASEFDKWLAGQPRTATGS